MNNILKFCFAIVFFSLILIGCNQKPSACDCDIVQKGAFGPNPEVRAAAARIIGNDNAINNPERAARKCRLDYSDEYNAWKKKNYPDRTLSTEWEEFFSKLCKQ